MRLEEMKSPTGANKRRKRVGRGAGSGHGKTCCRGQDGQKSRSGGGVRPGFEGGQMPLQRRIPKRGFTNAFRKEYAIVNLDRLNIFEEGAEITPEVLKEAGLVKSLKNGVKVLGRGKLEKKINLKINKISEQAKEQIIALGGQVEVI